MDDTQIERWRAAIGPNAERYLRRFGRIEQAGGRAWGWNTAAFLHSTGWFCYRRMHRWAFLNLCAPFVLLLGTAILTAGIAVPFVLLAYLLVVFVLVPMYADSIYHRDLQLRLADSRHVPRPPSIRTALGGLALGAIWLVVIAAVLSTVNAAYGDYTVRAKTSAAVLATFPMRDEITEFHAKNRRLPAAQEVRPWAGDPSMNWVESVVYEPAEKRIVGVLRDIQPGKRFALYATQANDGLAWTCRTIDLDRKYLPPACRD